MSTGAAPGPYTKILSPHVSKGLRKKDPPMIVLHTSEGHEGMNSARGTAAWFVNPASMVSAHAIVDDREVIQCAEWDQIAWHAGAANGFSIGIELAGAAEQTGEQWLDPFSVAMLKRAAALFADLCIFYAIPVVRLSVDDVKANHAGGSVKGICAHVDVSTALGGTHWDPGPNFPWLNFLLAVQANVAIKSA